MCPAWGVAQAAGKSLVPQNRPLGSSTNELGPRLRELGPSAPSCSPARGVGFSGLRGRSSLRSLFSVSPPAVGQADAPPWAPLLSFWAPDYEGPTGAGALQSQVGDYKLRFQQEPKGKGIPGSA